MTFMTFAASRRLVGGRLVAALLTRQSNNTTFLHSPFLYDDTTSTSTSMRSRSKSSISTSTITTDEGIIIHQSDPSTTGGTSTQGLIWGSVLWPSGIALAKYVYGHPFHSHILETPPLQTVPSSHQESSSWKVLELGCGTGIVGLTLAKKTATVNHHHHHNSNKKTMKMTLTDSESSLWPLLRQSIAANGLRMHEQHDADRSDDERKSCKSPQQPSSPCIQIHHLDWRDPSTFLMDEVFDLVLAADVLYSGMDRLFARALASHLCRSDATTTSTVALVASPFRKDSPLVGFLQACHRLGLRVYRLEDEKGRAVGTSTGQNGNEVYHDSRFVQVAHDEDHNGDDNDDNNDDQGERIKKSQDDSDSRDDIVRTHDEIGVRPLFAPTNLQKVQIFRIHRVSGSPQDAASIRRIRQV